MPSPLSRRLSKAEAAVGVAGVPAALHVVTTAREYYRVRGLFAVPPIRPAAPTATGPYALTFGAAVREGVVVVTAEGWADLFASECERARWGYRCLRLDAERRAEYNPLAAYAVVDRRTDRLYFVGSTEEAMKAEAGCPDAVWLQEFAAAFESEHPDAEALLAAYRDERDRRDHERQRQIHLDAGRPDPGPWPGPWRERRASGEGA